MTVYWHGHFLYSTDGTRPSLDGYVCTLNTPVNTIYSYSILNTKILPDVAATLSRLGSCLEMGKGAYWLAGINIWQLLPWVNIARLNSFPQRASRDDEGMVLCTWTEINSRASHGDMESNLDDSQPHVHPNPLSAEARIYPDQVLKNRSVKHQTLAGKTPRVGQLYMTRSVCRLATWDIAEAVVVLIMRGIYHRKV